MSIRTDKPGSGLITNREEIIKLIQELGLDFNPSDQISMDVRKLVVFELDGHFNSNEVEPPPHLLPKKLPKSWTMNQALGNIERCENGIVKGQTSLYMNEAWSGAMVHSSDLMLPVSILLSELGLGEDDINSIDSFRISDLIWREMTIYGKRGGQLKELLSENKSPDFSIKLSTKAGESIEIVGFQGENEIPVHHFSNRIVQDLMSEFYDYTVINGEAEFPLRSSLLGQNLEAANLNMPLAARLASPMDLLMYAIGYAQKNILKEMPINFSYGLAGGFEQFNIPSLRDLMTGGLLVIHVPSVDTIKKTKTEYVIVPIHFRFENKRGSKIGGGIFNLAAPQKTEGK